MVETICLRSSQRFINLLPTVLLKAEDEKSTPSQVSPLKVNPRGFSSANLVGNAKSISADIALTHILKKQKLLSIRSDFQQRKMGEKSGGLPRRPLHLGPLRQHLYWATMETHKFLTGQLIWALQDKRMM
jgi:hypothetical protein